MGLTPKNRADYLRNLADRIDGIGKPRFNDLVSGDPRALRECADAILEIERARHAAAVAFAEHTYAAPVRERSTDEKITALAARLAALEFSRDPQNSLHEQGQETRLARMEQRLTLLEGRVKRAGRAVLGD